MKDKNYSAGYSQALMDLTGVRVDSADPDEYVEGWMEASRFDQAKCKAGNKPCGKTCIPMKNKCRSQGGGGKIAATGAGLAAASAIGAAGLKSLGKKKKTESTRAFKDNSRKALPAAGQSGGDVTKTASQRVLTTDPAHNKSPQQIEIDGNDKTTEKKKKGGVKKAGESAANFVKKQINKRKKSS